MKYISKIVSVSLPASFTIEAAVILPISFIIIAWFLTSAIRLHGQVVSYADNIYSVMAAAPDGSSDEGSDQDGAAASINMKNLKARNVILSYKLLKDGVKTITGGLTDED